VESPDNDHLRVDTWRHDAVTKDVAVGDEALVGDPSFAGLHLPHSEAVVPRAEVKLVVELPPALGPERAVGTGFGLVAGELVLAAELELGLGRAYAEAVAAAGP